MSTFTHESMINHHGQSLLSQVAETLHVWRQRYEQRRELAHWSDRELHDIGVVLQRRDLRGLKTVLAGIKGSQAGVASPEGRRPSFFASDGSVR